jgi:gluconokinase
MEGIQDRSAGDRDLHKARRVATSPNDQVSACSDPLSPAGPPALPSPYPSGMDSTRIDADRRLAVVVMGVAGSGKSTIAAGIAELLSLPFIEGDELHSPLSVAKMKAGVALEDDDRWPWLDRIAARLADKERMPLGLVITCSALKRSYRDRVRHGAPGVRFVFLQGPGALIESRLAARTHHFMPSTLLASQLQTLESPGPDEDDVLHADIAEPSTTVIRLVASALRAAAT